MSDAIGPRLGEHPLAQREIDLLLLSDVMGKYHFCHAPAWLECRIDAEAVEANGSGRVGISLRARACLFGVATFTNRKVPVLDPDRDTLGYWLERVGGPSIGIDG